MPKTASKGKTARTRQRATLGPLETARLGDNSFRFTKTLFADSHLVVDNALCAILRKKSLTDERTRNFLSEIRVSACAARTTSELAAAMEGKLDYVLLKFYGSPGSPGLKVDVGTDTGQTWEDIDVATWDGVELNLRFLQRAAALPPVLQTVCGFFCDGADSRKNPKNRVFKTVYLNYLLHE